MMCDGCKRLAERETRLLKRRAAGRDVGGSTVHLQHVVKTRKPRCEYPATCTCQHEPIAKGYVAR